MTDNTITEKDARAQWMPRAKQMTMDDLPEFLRELSEDYEHGYGTICIAIAAAAVAAAWAMERTPQGGITGFQAGAVTWEMIRGWDANMIGEIGTRIQKMDDLLYPQYVAKFTSIDVETWDAIQVKACQNLADKTDASPKVIAHWKSIASGMPPTGIRVRTETI